MQTHSNREQFTASYEWYRQMRETQPVFFDQKMQAWHIFRCCVLSTMCGARFVLPWKAMQVAAANSESG